MNLTQENFIGDELFYDNNKFIDYLINNLKINIFKDKKKENEKIQKIIENKIFSKKKNLDLYLDFLKPVDLEIIISNNNNIHQNKLMRSKSSNYFNSNSKLKKTTKNKKNIPIKNLDLTINYKF